MMQPFPKLASVLPTRRTPRTRLALIVSCIFLSLLILTAVAYSAAFGPLDKTSLSAESFVVHPDESFEEIAKTLYDSGFVRYSWALTIASFAMERRDAVRPGGYELSRSMDVWTVLSTLSQEPYFAWIEIPNGLRKEQIAEELARKLGWQKAEQEQFLGAQSVSPEFSEGVYLADTYLMPSDIAPEDAAARLRSSFQDAYAQFASEAAQKGKSWKDTLILASLIEREAAKNDKALIAGILSNRLKRGMQLQVDATLQYVTGTTTSWWDAPRSEDKYVDSPFNTYKYAGLPPAPIANPSKESIQAALNPVATSCLYYLHDGKGKIHCSATYKEHKANIQRFL